MTTIIFSSDLDTIKQWTQRYAIYNALSCYDLESLLRETKLIKEYVIIADFDTVAPYINKMITSNTLLQNIIVLENIPEIITGKMLIYQGIKAYGNSKMALVHYNQILHALKNKKIWTYPKLTAHLAKNANLKELSQESLELLEHRLSPKEKAVVMLIIRGFTNDAIAAELGISTRTVKAHISSIFSKLHINDRVALVLLLK